MVRTLRLTCAYEPVAQSYARLSLRAGANGYRDGSRLPLPRRSTCTAWTCSLSDRALRGAPASAQHCTEYGEAIEAFWGARDPLNCQQHMISPTTQLPSYPATQPLHGAQWVNPLAFYTHIVTAPPLNSQLTMQGNFTSAFMGTPSSPVLSVPPGSPNDTTQARTNNQPP